MPRSFTSRCAMLTSDRTTSAACHNHTKDTASVSLELQPDVLISELLGLGPQHRHPLSAADAGLIANGDEAVGEIEVVFAQDLDGHHEEVDVVENQRPTCSVGFFGL